MDAASDGLAAASLDVKEADFQITTWSSPSRTLAVITAKGEVQIDWKVVDAILDEGNRNIQWSYARIFKAIHKGDYTKL